MICLFLLGLAFENLVTAKLFSSEPQDQLVDVNHPRNRHASFSCEANLTEAEYKWKKDGKDLNVRDQSRFEVNKDGSLLVTSLQDGDAGMYQCIASNYEGTALSNLAQLTLKYLREFPQVERQPNSTPAGIGVNIACDDASYSPENSVHFIWTKTDPFEKLGDANSIEYLVSQNDGTLYLANPTPDDTGVYYCQVQERKTIVYYESPGVSLIFSQNAKAKNQVAPKLILHPKPITWTKVGRKEKIFECFASGNPTPKISWKKINGNLPKNHEIYGGHLYVYDITDDMAGTYECIAENNVGSVNFSWQLKIEAKPSWVKEISSQNSKYFQNVTFECKAMGTPQPEYQWMRNGVPVVVTSHILVSVGTNGGSKMTIKEVTEEDVGIYQCVAENRAGIIYSNAKLLLQDPIFTTEPKCQRFIHSGRRTKAVLHCCANITDCQYSWTKNGVQLSSDEYRVDKIKNGSLSITSLSPYDTGTYQCVASSNRGTALSNLAHLLVKSSYFGLQQTHSIIVKAGNGISIPCENATCQPADLFGFMWITRKGVRYGITKQRHYYVSQLDGTLYFANPQTDQSDDFRCYVVNNNDPSDYVGSEFTKVTIKDVGDSDKQQKPKILLQPKPITYIEIGNSATLECFASGNPIPNLHWEKVNGSLPENHVISVSRQLVLNDVTIDADGLYRCTASNTLGDVMSYGRVVVTEKSFFKQAPISKPSKLMKRLTWYCKAGGKPTPTITWTKNGVKLTNKQIEIVGTKGESSLTISNVTEEDVGIYQCVAKNKAGIIYSNAKLTLIDFLPELIYPVADSTKVTEHSKVELKCELLSYPKADIYWSKDGVNINNERGVILQIVNASKSDEGKYTCTAINKMGKISSTGMLIVYDESKLLKFPSNHTMLFGESKNLTCETSKDKRLSLKWEWKFNGSFMFKGGKNSYKLTDVTKEASGIYECCAITEMETKCSIAFINVEGPPDHPIMNKVTSSGSTWQFISWLKPNNNGATITNYDVENMNEFNFVWNKIATTSRESITITNLYPYVGYSYRVRAWNKHGSSEFSYSTEFTKTSPGAPASSPSNVRCQITASGEMFVTWKPISRIYYGYENVTYKVLFLGITNNIITQVVNSNVCDENQCHFTYKAQDSLSKWKSVRVYVVNAYGQNETMFYDVTGAEESGNWKKNVWHSVISFTCGVFLLVAMINFCMLRASTYFKKLHKRHHHPTDGGQLEPLKRVTFKSPSGKEKLRKNEEQFRERETSSVISTETNFTTLNLKCLLEPKGYITIKNFRNPGDSHSNSVELFSAKH